MDCVRAASRTAPQARTAFGAPMRGGVPVVTTTLIGLNVVGFLLQLAVGDRFTNALIFAPSVGDVEPWRFLTSAFLHDPSSFLHIAFNMYALWVLGQNLEPALGRWRFVSLYLLSAIGGAVMVTLLATPGLGGTWQQGVVGASGAVFGLFGAILVVLRRLGRSASGILVILAINAVIGFVVPRISWEAHLGGLLVGLVLGGAYAYAPKARRRTIGVGATVGVGILLVVLAALKYATV
ncbi:rhomboid family intramembrane serine protease [Cellulomonas sp. KRMCY2]|uniref:rhomboid family intramembrane serine protease n=1 Tax=Cellulomonas sp. KRMCY2 TaxID=1304865 RepID=UPI0035104C73